MLWIEDLRKVHLDIFVEIMWIVCIFITLMQEGAERLLHALLNHVQKIKGFVFKKVQGASPEKTEIDVLVEARANSQPRFRPCGRKGPGHGRHPVRRFASLPLWEIPVMPVMLLGEWRVPGAAFAGKAFPGRFRRIPRIR